MIDHAGLQQASDGPFHERAPVELTECFGNADAQPLTRPCSRDYGDDGCVQEALKKRLGSRSQNLIEDGFRLGVVGAFGKRQLTDQNLARLGQHALLARGQAALLVAPP